MKQYLVSLPKKQSEAVEEAAYRIRVSPEQMLQALALGQLNGFKGHDPEQVDGMLNADYRKYVLGIQ